MAGQLDARAKFVAVALSIVIVTTVPLSGWIVVVPQFALAILAALTGGARLVPIGKRLLVGLPIVLIAAALLYLAESWERGLTVALKGATALVLLSALTVTTPVAEMVWAIRKLGVPRSVNLIASMMLRYIEMLAEEFSRMSRARAARAGGPLAGVALFQAHGNQAGLLLVRSWERAERIHGAMLSRGFSELMPETKRHRMRAADYAVAILLPGAFLALRFVNL